MAGSRVEVDQTRPSSARVYDYLLGGKDNYAVDRAVGDRFKYGLPGSVAMAHANRRAVVRGVHAMAAEAGIRQFVDLGSGLPTADNVHQVVQRHAPGSRVLYVDNDPIVLAHGRALLAENADTEVVAGDVRRSEAVREHPDTVRLIDFDRPVGVVLAGVLHHLDDHEDPAGVVAYWRDQVPAGSHFLISHFRIGDHREGREAEQQLQSAFGRGRWRTGEEIAALFAGLDLLPPGIVPASQWRPDDDPADCPRIGADTGVWEQLIVTGLAAKR